MKFLDYHKTKQRVNLYDVNLKVPFLRKIEVSFNTPYTFVDWGDGRLKFTFGIHLRSRSDFKLETFRPIPPPSLTTDPVLDHRRQRNSLSLLWINRI